jgi:hypothetical protein
MLPVALTNAIEALEPADIGYHDLVAELYRYLVSILAPEEQIWDCCPKGADCWRTGVKRPVTMHARVPYVGPRYPSGRVLLIAMNGRNDGGVDSELREVPTIAGRFANGLSDWGGQFTYKTAVVASILASARRGELSMLSLARPENVVDDWLASAKLQAVQCSPVTPDRRNGPTRHMWRNCPPLLLERQIQIMEPEVVVLLSEPTHRAVQHLPNLRVHWRSSWAENSRCFARGTCCPGTTPVPLFALNHPSAFGTAWGDSIRMLIDSLNTQPL